MRKIIAKVVYCLLWFKIRKESQRTDSVLCIYGHNQKQRPFEDLVKWLLRNDYHFITPQNLYLFLQGDVLQYSKNVWLSFDDGWKSNYTDILPILKKYNIPCTIFLATKGMEDGYYWFKRALQNRDSDLYERVDDLWKMPNSERVRIIDQLPPFVGERLTMNVEEVKEMTASGLVTWGNHTNDHVITDRCSDEELSDEIDLCHDKILGITGTDCNFIYSYPNGDFDERSVDLIMEKGFKLAVTVNNGRVYRNSNPYKINRNEFKNGCLEENILQSFGLWTPFFNKFKRVLGIKNHK